MAIKLDARTTGIIPRDILLDAQDKPGEVEPAQRKELRAMEKPKTLSTPQAQQSELGKRASGEMPKLRQHTQVLLDNIRSPGPNQLSAARAALAAAGTYAMRRSKGARRSAIELLEAVAESVPELSTEALKLRHVLIAEGYLHRCDADATLRAIRALVGMLDEDAPDEEAP